MVEIKTELAYQKQPAIFQNKKRVLLGETGKEKLPRYHQNTGLGFKTPKEAIEGTYIDKKCPSQLMFPSVADSVRCGDQEDAENHCHRRGDLHYVRKYNRFERRHQNMSAHLCPCFRAVQVGDITTVGECWPLSKTARFDVLEGTKKQFQRF